MEKIYESVSKFIDTKLRDPFTNTFIIAWVVWNWKPIIFFIFSKESAETKIWFITARYSDIYHVFLYPFSLTIAILILIPIILAGIEYILHFFKKFRLGIEGNIAKKKNDVENKVLVAREVGDVNVYIDNLKKQISTHLSDLKAERTKISELTEQNSKDINEKNKIIETLNSQLQNGRSSAFTAELINANTTLVEENIALKNKFIVSLKKEPKIIKSGDTYVLEILNTNNEILWYDFNNDTDYSPFGLSIYKDQNADEISDPEMLRNALEKFKNSRFNI